MKKTVLPAEVDPVLDNTVGPSAYHRDDAQRRAVLRHYELNLRRIVALARRAGAAVVLAVPASNLRDCAPFKSEPAADVSPDDAARFRARVAAAAAAPSAAAAIEELRRALAIDARHAETHYRLGRRTLERGAGAAAAVHFIRARDEDVCPLRALSDQEEIVRRVAADLDVAIVDFTAVASERSPGGIPGANLFIDHVHLTVEGHGLLARAIIEAAASTRLMRADISRLDEVIPGVARRVHSRIDPRTRGIALRNLAKVLGWAGKFEEADRLAARAVHLAPDDPEARCFYGAALLRAGSNQTARAAFQQALRLDPGLARAHYNLGFLALRERRLDDAAAHYARTIELDPRQSRAHRDLGAVLLLAGDLAAAERHLEGALDLQPSDADALANLASLRLRQGRPADAAVLARDAADLQPDLAAAHHNLALALFHEGRCTDAVAACRRAARLAPRNPDIRNDLALMLERTGRSDEALRLYREALRLAPNHPRARNNLRRLESKTEVAE
jgi:Flp pilus assembly protein TadD